MDELEVIQKLIVILEAVRKRRNWRISIEVGYLYEACGTVNFPNNLQYGTVPVVYDYPNIADGEQQS